MRDYCCDFVWITLCQWWDTLRPGLQKRLFRIRWNILSRKKYFRSFVNHDSYLRSCVLRLIVSRSDFATLRMMYIGDFQHISFAIYENMRKIYDWKWTKQKSLIILIRILVISIRIIIDSKRKFWFVHFQSEFQHAKNDFVEVSKNLVKYDLRIILLDHQNNYVGISSMVSNAAKRRKEFRYSSN